MKNYGKYTMYQSRTCIDSVYQALSLSIQYGPGNEANE